VPRVPGLPAFTGGLVGYFGFESIGYVEPRWPAATSPTSSARPTPS
jgi:anthranilate synthase component 1